jgi:riboflavin synthase
VFTGIVETAGTLSGLNRGKMRVATPWKGKALHVGQSISVDGCCLTIVGIRKNEIAFDLSPETLDRTVFGVKKRGDLVNLERAMRMNGALDGHLVTGHVDTRGVIRSAAILDDGTSWEVWIDVPKRFHRWLIEKGSAAVDGVSLTVVGIDRKGFSVVLIPHTIEITSLRKWKKGAVVNVEFDLIAKYIERLVRP